METSESGPKSSTMRNPRQGGFRAAGFIFAMTALENVGFVANAVSLVLYFYTIMHFNIAGSSTTLTNFMGATFLLTILGGFISDTYLTRLNTVLLFGFFEILGYILLTIQAKDDNLRPRLECSACKLQGSGAVMFYITLSLLALGFGGVRGSLPALGADQFDRNNLNERKHLASFFNWLLLSVTSGATLGVTVIVWVYEEKSWSLGFFISMLLALLGFFAVTLGKPFYRVRVPGDSPLVRLVQVMIVAVRNRKLALPKSSDGLYEVNEKDDEFVGERIPHSDQFGWLDKAAVLGEGSTPEPWRVCSVTQVEELKIVIRMLPILGSTIIMNTSLSQLQTFSVQQGYIMNLYLGSFKVPPASIPVIPLVSMSLLIPIYEFAFVPFVRKFTGHPAGITHLQRVGIGLVLSAISMSTAAIIEVKRRNAFNHEFKQISLFWLSFQYGIFGIADMFTFVGLMEFFYSEAPACMRSLSTSFSFLSLSFGYFLSSVFVQLINSITRRVTTNKQGWVEGQDLNSIHLDLFYWFLAILSCLNFVLYLFCATWYKYRNDNPDAKPKENARTVLSQRENPDTEGKENGCTDLSQRENPDTEGKENGCTDLSQRENPNTEKKENGCTDLPQRESPSTEGKENSCTDLPQRESPSTVDKESHDGDGLDEVKCGSTNVDKLKGEALA